MEKLYRHAKKLENDFSEIASQLFTNSGLAKAEDTSLELMAYSIGVLMSNLNILRVALLGKYKDKIEKDNNAKYDI